MTSAILSVPAISCGHCERTITETLQPKEGVASVRVDIPAKEVHVDFDPEKISLAHIGELLAEEEYPVDAARSE